MLTSCKKPSFWANTMVHGCFNMWLICTFSCPGHHKHITQHTVPWASARGAGSTSPQSHRGCTNSPCNREASDSLHSPDVSHSVSIYKEISLACYSQLSNFPITAPRDANSTPKDFQGLSSSSIPPTSSCTFTLQLVWSVCFSNKYVTAP